MRAIRYYGPGDLRLDVIPEPVPKEGQVKIKVAWNGICGSDLHAYLSPLPITIVPTDKEPHYVTKETLPIVFGHEFSGTIVELGTEVDSSRLAVGQNVAIEPIISCMEPTCGPCSVGTKNVCPHCSFIGLAGWGGGLSEYVTVNEDFVHVLPPGVPLEIGAMIEPLAVAWHAVKRSAFTTGDSVLIVGAGPIGLLLLKTVKALGATWIGISEPASRRREIALAHSASAAYDPLTTDVITETFKATNGRGADVVFDCVGIQASLDTALKAVRPRGNVVNIAVWEKPATLDVNIILLKEIVFTATIGYDRVHPELLQAVGEGKFQGLEQLITRKIPLEDVVEKGIKTLLKEKDTQIKILVHP